ncbi:uncharacterized protein PODANS_4_9270 [Podospora anserina S mat+]|uniref:Podospora anserina S mat+ genomic DNA chromosome 4, supercontig 4 n=1 Tax=Podospora anserina (strain S / ATCC MYA-4624 / DSM 980 / FGSC 10383) TaxID=515849 RepID=B2AQY6_PODAN|nr:uncharacterized protein PODANS_4_9270 [Podospora anserina S mat+]CAP66564.1 unnamed protein product [Podospora anserina S mat+]CDP28296.1 Putative splicing factor spf30 [Podospora anserina S mat+]
MSAELEAERQEYENQLELVVTSLKDDPDNAELQTLKGDLEGMIQMINDSIAELKPKSAPAPPKRQPSPPPAPKEKWSRENHPAFKKAGPEAAEEKESDVVVNYQVNDTVMAKWATGDKGFYPARITSVTGSKTAPIYTVKFKSYDTVETLRAKDIKPMPAQKRKADGISTAPTAGPSSSSSTPAYGSGSATPTVNNGIVKSAPADMYPQAQAAAENNPDEKPKPKFKKIKATKELEAGKNKWQEFTQKGKFGKAAKKESMFRTPEGVKGRGIRVYWLWPDHAQRPYPQSAHLPTQRRFGLSILQKSLGLTRVVFYFQNLFRPPMGDYSFSSRRS